LLSDSTSFAYLDSTALSEQQIALKLMIYYKPLSPQHDWCLPWAPHVRSISTICAERQHIAKKHEEKDIFVPIIYRRYSQRK